LKTQIWTALIALLAIKYLQMRTSLPSWLILYSVEPSRG
jgi:hypothetical protein